MYFEQLWAGFLSFQGMQGMYFKLLANEELCFTVSECNPELETEAKTPLCFHEHWVAGRGQLMTGDVSFWKHNQTMEILFCKDQT